MNSVPFINVSWRRPFLPALIDIALDLTGGDISRAFFVFPHTRPALYLTEAIREDKRIAKPCILPHMESMTSLFSRIRASTHGSGLSVTPVGLLDQTALLLAVIRNLRAWRGGLLRNLPLDDSRRFFPWGVRLANLMEEFFTHNLTPEEYIYMEGQVAPFAAALLENLGAIHAGYVAELEKRGWTTPGFDAIAVVRAISRGEDLSQLPILAGKKIILAGFHTLTGSQRILFRRLWERHGAAICLHADPGVVEGSPHWSCTDLVHWAGSWGTKIMPFAGKNDEEQISVTQPMISFRAGYDVHSQLSELATEFTREGTANRSRAVVLPDTSLLLPVLHHLPAMDLNISMGYPLVRSPLFRLIEAVLVLQEKKRGNGPFAYYWKDVIELLRHPYCKMLAPSYETSGGTAEELRAAPNMFRRFLHYAERVVRNSRRFETVTNLAERTTVTMTKTGAEASSESIALFKRVLDTAVLRWEGIETPDDLAAALQGITDLIREHGTDLWKRFPIDAECLYRLTESVIPQFAHTALKEENLPVQAIFAVLRELLSEERVPFEAYPLVGDQVLGVLETRLMHFDRVFILDLTEDKLPGSGGYDPLLPDSLRPLVGLPGKRGREKVTAYNFFRLINGARQVTLYWQEGIAPQGLHDAKKTRSRFVEELLWKEERKIKRILAPEKAENQGTDGPLRLIPCILPPVLRENRNIPMTDSARARMREILAGDISPSLLDAYARCPARFFYQRLGRIREVEGAVEGLDPLGVGLFLHETLRRYFVDRLDIPVTADARSIENLRAVFLEELAGSELRRTIPSDERIMLEEAAPPILASILENHAGRIPRHLEKTFRAKLVVDGAERILSGIADRVDEYDGALLVLDYKTGHVPLVTPSVWRNDEFWQSLMLWRPGGDDKAFDALARAFASVQLPAYIHMVGLHTGKTVHDAAYVPFRIGAEDEFLFGEKMDDETRELAVKERIPMLLTFLLRHMENAKQFSPRTGQHCGWCLYKNMCTVTRQF